MGAALAYLSVSPVLLLTEVCGPALSLLASVMLHAMLRLLLLLSMLPVPLLL